MRPKCLDCRKLAKELDTPWQRFKYLIVEKFFRYEMTEIQQEYYTRGFGDGYKDGFQWAAQKEKEEREKFLNMMVIHEPKYEPIDPHDLIKFSAEGVQIGDWNLVQNEISNLIEETKTLKHSRVWGLLTTYLKEKAHQVMFYKSKDYQDLLNGKMMLYNIDVQEKFIELLLKLDEKKIEHRERN